MSFIVIQHYQFPIRDPFEAGHVLTEVEAGVLNWHRAGLVQKTVQRWVLEVISETDDLLSQEQLSELETRIKEFDSNYEFSPRRPTKKSNLEFNLDLVASGVLLRAGEFEPSDEELELVKKTPEVQARARDIIRSSTFSRDELVGGD